MTGSVISGDGLNEFVRGQEAVIHLVGIIREVGENTFDKVHRVGTNQILSAVTQEGISKYFHMSALGTRENAVSTYHRTKWESELTVHASSLNWTIFRPSIIFGPEDNFINMLAGVMKNSPVMPVIGGGKNLMQPVWVKDVASAYAAALEQEDVTGKTFELGGPETLNFKEILKLIAHVINKQRLFVPVAPGIVQFAIGIAQSVGIQLPITKDQLQMLLENNIVGEGVPIEELGINPLSLEDGIRGYLK
jgi:NADH dehydrogenase